MYEAKRRLFSGTKLTTVWTYTVHVSFAQLECSALKLRSKFTLSLVRFYTTLYTSSFIVVASDR